MDEQQMKAYFLRGCLGLSRDLHHVTLCLRQSPHRPSWLVNPSIVPTKSDDNVQISQVNRPDQTSE